jgi:hypothetical protein
MPWMRGTGTTDEELARVQAWIEFWDPRIDGGDGKGIGMYAEWQEWKAKSSAFQTFMKVGVSIVTVLAAFVGLLVGLSSIGVVHLR